MSASRAAFANAASFSASSFAFSVAAASVTTASAAVAPAATTAKAGIYSILFCVTAGRESHSARKLQRIPSRLPAVSDSVCRAQVLFVHDVGSSSLVAG
jgi:hypothetical protein